MLIIDSVSQYLLGHSSALCPSLRVQRLVCQADAEQARWCALERWLYDSGGGNQPGGVEPNLPSAALVFLGYTICLEVGGAHRGGVGEGAWKSSPSSSEVLGPCTEGPQDAGWE